jgi:hypothetical protein
VDITDSLAPKSDQLDAIELVAGPRTFTITGVSPGTDEQPVSVSFAEFPRVWRPSKGMRRLLAAGWGTDSKTWTGRRVTLYFDPDVSFGKERTGGTRISHMSHLPGGKRLSVPLLVSRGKSQMFIVEPLPDTPALVDDIATATDTTALRAMWKTSDAGRRARIEARIAELKAQAGEPA